MIKKLFKKSEFAVNILYENIWLKKTKYRESVKNNTKNA